MPTPEQLLEHLIVLRAQTGDAEAFVKLVERYEARVIYFVRRTLGDQDNCEDVLQQIWMTAYEKLTKLEHPAAFRTWLYRIARNRAIDSLREKPAAVHEELSEEIGDEAIEEPFSAEDAAAVHAALGKLRAEHREVLVLRFMEEMDYAGIAEVIGKDVGTVKSRIFYGKKALRELLEK